MTGLYIHIPFCHSKCIYCDFYSRAGSHDFDALTAGLLRELDARRDEPGARRPDTIYLGGGTPSILPPRRLTALVEGLPRDGVAEFTIEVNPEDVSPAAVALWRSLGINRVSMGVQSLDDGMLRWMRRRHSADDARRAVSTIYSGGIDNISCDLIYGLPRLGLDTWRQSLDGILALEISHLSAYCLSYSDGTALQLRRDRGLDPVADDYAVAAQYDILCESAARAGMDHYEISNFGHPGRHSLHNSIYWDSRGRWLGLGPSAHSFDGRLRRIDVPDSRVWLSRLPYPCDIDPEDDLDRLNDIIVTALRTARGLDLSVLPDDVAHSVSADAAPFISDGHMHSDGRFLSIDERSWLIADRFIRELIRI